MTPPDEVVGLAAKLSEALAAYDDKYSTCPFSPSFNGPAVAYGDACPKCRATPRDACHVGAAAGHQLAVALRAHLTGGIHE